MRARKLIIGCLFGSLLVAPVEAQAHPQSESPKRCHVHWRRSLEAKRRLVRCVGEWVRPPGGWRKAWAVESCESGHNPYFRSRSYVTAYSHTHEGWRARSRSLLYTRAARRRAIEKWWDYRLQQIVTMRWVRAKGRWTGTDAFPECGRR